MSVTAGTPTSVINNFNVFEAIVPLTVSGSYPGTPGDTLNLSGLVPTNSVPLLVEIYEQPPAGTAASGLTFKFATGTTLANGQLQAYNGTSQLGNVTYASVNVANLVARCVFKKFV
jgi:hypothetical protein